ncbi:choline/ethanolamine kinase-like isoform X1 [Daphnia pulex]|uniref:choline/ethanolamine kinase-like isoform X1 n=2 Tax=Daphnia pulex TaxID=6669 RepID=UPI001EDD0506|nr:choline/ethanolamine kinase-like isoform X1 [Daphnia pulex]
MSITSSNKSEMREKTFRICRDYLNGIWKMIAPQEMVLKQVSGGMSNFLYYCALPPMAKPKQGEPSRVLVRFYGQIHGEGALEALLTESVIFTLLSERKLGPKLHGVFPGGRLEEFIPARPLKTKELVDPEISSIIAEKMAQIHSLDVPISKEPTWLWDTMNRWMSNMKVTLAAQPTHQIVDNDFIEKDVSSAMRSILSWKLDSEMDWMKTYLTQLRSPVVFCHNDLQEGNILIRESAVTREEKLVIIDFEYCSYNYRGFDVANHFCEWMYDYTFDKYPKFTYNPAAMPSVEQQLYFIRYYLETVQREMGIDDSHKNPIMNTIDAGPQNELRLLREAECYMLASHFFWGLWAVVNAPVSSIPFGYWEYAEARFAAYFEHKQNLLRKYGEVIEENV